MSTVETRIAEVLAGHGQHDYRFNGGDWSDNCACGFKLFGIDYSPEHKTFPGMSYADCAFAAHQAAALAPVIAEAKAEALKAEATNLRELHTLIEDTPWNPMPAEDKVRCTEFMAESGVDDHEYTDRHLNNYAAWLDHRAEQIRSNDE